MKLTETTDAEPALMISHLLELRRRLLAMMIVFFLLFGLLFLWSDILFLWVVSPVLEMLPAGSTLIATQITTPVFTPLHVAFDTALLITAPLAIGQLWQFIAPGLYPEERQGIGTLLLISIGLFAFGMLFCFYVALPCMLHIFALMVPAGVQLMPDMANAASFVLRMLLLFGLCFQVPLICLLLVRLRMIEVATLVTIRPYVIVSAFILGMLLTPPDVVSQIMLAIPLCLLYETGIFLVKLRQAWQC